jgi:hypothetical protein
MACGTHTVHFDFDGTFEMLALILRALPALGF